MTSTVPGPAREFVRALTQAVDTALSGRDAAAYDYTTARLVDHPSGGRVLGDVLRLLLEDTHPDGVDSDDITLLIGRCYRTAAAWLPPARVNAIVLLAALASALGIHEPGITYEALDLLHPDARDYHEPDDTIPVPVPTWPDYAWHAPLLLADLLPFAPATLENYLDITFAEYARQAREEFP